MGDRRTEKFKTLLAEVNGILYEDWAPIGFAGAVPRDEYESYAMRVISLLASGATEADIAKYLAEAALAISGNSTDAASVQEVARRLMSFREAANAIAP